MNEYLSIVSKKRNKVKRHSLICSHIWLIHVCIDNTNSMKFGEVLCYQIQMPFIFGALFSDIGQYF